MGKRKKYILYAINVRTIFFNKLGKNVIYLIQNNSFFK